MPAHRWRATDVAKSAAGILLTEAGLAGIVAAVREGRGPLQRILTYTLRSLVHKVRQVLFLAVGLAVHGTRYPDAAHDGAADDHRRLSCHVGNDGQCGPVDKTELRRIDSTRSPALFWDCLT